MMNLNLGCAAQKAKTVGEKDERINSLNWTRERVTGLNITRIEKLTDFEMETQLVFLFCFISVVNKGKTVGFGLPDRFY